ncbi:MAG: hypothetical protein AB1716_01245 [Planctomycetota bacterium]
MDPSEAAMPHEYAPRTAEGASDAGAAAETGGLDARAPAEPRLPRWLAVALGAVILAGVVLRVAAPGTTVFCDDQARACALAQDIASGRWETAGLVNSGQFRNLPGYAYILAGIWRLWPDPMALLAFTMGANLAALAGAAYLARRWFGSAAAWWATAFFAAAPWAIHYCRWIFAQHLLFPAALLVYVSAWQWLGRGRRWAALGFMLALGLLIQIHLAGIVLLLALGLLAVIHRPGFLLGRRLPFVPLGIGAVLVVASVAPWFAGGHYRAPQEQRFGYHHAWRVAPAAAMSVTGLGWSLEFRGGYPGFMRQLGARRGVYTDAMAVPPVLLGGAFAAAVVALRRDGQRGAAPGAERGGKRRAGNPGETERRPLTPLGLVVGLVVLIPLAFVLLGVRTSPTYLPIWYPLPFLLMGWAAARLTRAPRGPCVITVVVLLGVPALELAFFTEQLGYIRRHGGVPDSLLDRSYAGLLADRARLTNEVAADEVWVTYAGNSEIMNEATAYIFRRGAWRAGGGDGGRVLIHYEPWVGGTSVERLDPAAQLPATAWLVYPWHGPQQRGGRVLRAPPSY